MARSHPLNNLLPRVQLQGAPQIVDSSHRQAFAHQMATQKIVTVKEKEQKGIYFVKLDDSTIDFVESSNDQALVSCIFAENSFSGDIVYRIIQIIKPIKIMSKETYSTPKSPSARYDFERNVIKLINTHALEWQVDSAKVAALFPLAATYEQAYSIANNKSTQCPAATTARETAWAPLEEALIDIYNHELLNNDLISAADKESLYIHQIGTGGGGGQSYAAPTTTPIVTLTSEKISVLYVVYSDSSSPASHSKPDGVGFCELAYSIGTAPESVADCSERCNISRSHDPMVFSGDQRSKILYAYARWVNRNGKYGPWSGIISAIIP